MKTFLVVNPGSANGVTGKKWPELAGHISRRLGDFGHQFTDGPMHAATIAREALQRGFECIVAVGGDGTVNEVLNGFFSESGEALRPNACLGVLPRGTGGDFRRTFGWDRDDLAASLDRLASPSSRPFDVGRLEYLDHDGNRRSRYFANICSFGVSGVVDQEVNKSTKALGGKLSFMLGSAKAMLKYKDRTVRIRVDGGAPETVQVTTLAVANGRFFGGGMQVAPDADPSDGWFDVTLWSGYTLMDFVVKTKALYDGTHTRFPGTRQLRCKRLEAESDQEVLLDVDGEQPGRLPCAMELLPSAIRLKV